MNTARRTLLFLLFVVTSLCQLSAQDITREQQRLINDVVGRLLSEAELTPEFEAKYTWPPHLQVFSDNAQMESLGISSHNAFATIRLDENGKPILDKNGRYQTLVGITLPLIQDWVPGNPDGLAFVLAHELSHLLLQHVPLPRELPGPELVAAGRKRELDADANGLRLAMAAGYSPSGITKLWKRLQDRGEQHCSIDHVAALHPSWDDRFRMLNPEQSELWKALGAFRTGNFLVNTGQYKAAIQCFERVVGEFPKAAEAHANLGYARLMLYLDQLKKKDFERLDVAHFVPMGVLMRARSVEVQLRGFDKKVWQAAVTALEKAIELDPELYLAHANLGVAYLTHFDGTKAKEACRCLDDAAQAMDGKHVANHTQGGVLANGAVAMLHFGQTDRAEKLLAAVFQLFNKQLQRSREFIEKNVPEDRQEEALAVAFKLAAWQWQVVLDATTFNKAMVMTQRATDEQTTVAAFNAWVEYLKTAPGDSIWWDAAWSRLQQVAKKAGRKIPDRPRPEPQAFRPVFAVEVPGKGPLALSVDVSDAEELLGDLEAVPVANEGAMGRLRSATHDIEVLADHQVLAIRLVGPKAPPIELRGRELGGANATLRVGMPTAEMGELLFRFEAHRMELIRGLPVLYLPAIGLAMRFDDQKVLEIAVVQVAG